LPFSLQPPVVDLHFSEGDLDRRNLWHPTARPKGSDGQGRRNHRRPDGGGELVARRNPRSEDAVESVTCSRGVPSNRGARRNVVELAVGGQD
jgi:hypothetical protein